MEHYSDKSTNKLKLLYLLNFLGEIMFKKFLVILIFLIFSIGMVYASDNVTDDSVADNNIKIEVTNVDTYYKEQSQLVGYVKDNDNQPIENKTVDIKINGKTYSRISDESGKVSLDINLKANSYDANLSIGNTTYTNASVNVNKAPATMKASNLNVYVDSDIFFKVKLVNSATNNPLKNVKVLFRVYSDKTKYKDYYSNTDENGVASLNKNLKVGTYTIYTYVKDASVVSKRLKSTYKVKATAETGCCSFYVQVSNSEGVAGFRRDSTYAASLYLKVCKWHGRTAIKQYKTAHTYFFHSITTSDGWMMGTGGADNPGINKAIENLAGKMVKSGKITKSYLKKIQRYERILGIGHFAIKAPNGKYAVVWKNGIKMGKLKAGEYMSVPNSPYCFRHGTYAKFNTNPAKAALKIGATDVFGVNRRDITIYHWKATTDKNYKTTSKVTVYAANDNGHLMGRSTGHLKDNIYFKGKFISKNKLPKTPKMKKLGVHSFGNIDKLIKAPTTINAPGVINAFNTTKYFKVTVKNKKTKKVVSGVKIRVKLASDNFTKTYTLKTDKEGIAKLDTKDLIVGNYSVVISPANNKYLISGKSTIKIK